MRQEDLPFDVCLFCALAEEAEAVIEVFSQNTLIPFQEGFSTQSRRGFRYATIMNNAGERLNVHLSWPSAYGPVETALHLRPTLEEYQPRFVGMTGICAGDKEKVTLGDLIVADRAFLFDAGKFKSNNEGKILHLHDANPYHPDPLSLQYVQMFAAWKPPTDKLSRPQSKRQQREWLLSQLLDETTPQVQNIPEDELTKFAPLWRQIIEELKVNQLLTAELKLSDKAKIQDRRYGQEIFPYKDKPTADRYIAPMASGNAVRSDNPFQDVRTPVRGTSAIDMEGAAFYRTVADFSHIQCLLVKSVCDYADSDKDDTYHKYASLASATYMLSFIRQYVTQLLMPRTGFNQPDSESVVSLPSTTSSIALPTTSSSDFPHMIDLRLRVTQIMPPASAKPDFDLRVSFGNSYEDITSKRFVSNALNPRQILERSTWRSILIHAPGGHGKTKIMFMIANEAIDAGQIVLFLDMKTISDDEVLSEEFEMESFIDKTSIAGTPMDFKRALSEHNTLLLVDGLNEVSSTASRKILDLLARTTRDHSNLRIIVSDRMNSHSGIHFVRGLVDALSEQSIQDYLPEGAELPGAEADRQLLATPFFLDLQLRLWDAMSGTRHILARREMMEKAFSQFAAVTETELNTLAGAAYRCYRTYRSRSFMFSWWSEQVGAELAARLETAGLIQKANALISDDQFRIYGHQLLHDFLVGYYLAHIKPSEWQPSTFDIATFSANSFEPLSFAAELLETHADDFLVSVYDWNYRAVNHCIVDLNRTVKLSPISTDFVFAMAAKNAERQFDVFEDAIQSARERLEAIANSGQTFIGVSTSSIDDFLRAQTINDILDIVEASTPNKEAFKRWKTLFTLRHGSQVQEDDLLRLSEEPIVGWTVATSYRRVALSSEQVAQIHILYLYARELQQTDALRWRIVHLLGAFPTEKNAQLLQNASLNDNYPWARYGAVRSLMEIASHTTPELRNAILQHLISNLPGFSAQILHGLRRNSLVKDAAEGWHTAVLELILKAKLMPEATSESGAWQDTIVAIEQRVKTETSAE